MNICFFPFYIDKKSHQFKIMNFFKITTFFFKNHAISKSHYFKNHAISKSRDFKITLFQKSRDFKITRFQNHIISKITLFSKSRDFLPFLIIFKISVFLKKFPV